MTILAGHALAPAFTHTASVGPASDFGLTVGSSPVVGNLTSGTYRMWLAPSASCFLRALAAAITTAIAGEGETATCVATLSASGVATLTFDQDITSLDLSASVAARLGMSTLNVLVGSRTVTGTRPVWYLALLTAATGPYWQPHQPGGAERTQGGRVYTFASAITSWSRTLKVDFQPTTPTLRASLGCDSTALYPDEAYMGALGSTATGREWSVLDVLYSARNALCGYTGTWGTARTDTAARLWRVYVLPESLLSTPTDLKKAEWLAYATWTLGLSADSATPTETRT